MKAGNDQIWYCGRRRSGRFAGIVVPVVATCQQGPRSGVVAKCRGGRGGYSSSVVRYVGGHSY